MEHFKHKHVRCQRFSHLKIFVSNPSPAGFLLDQLVSQLKKKKTSNTAFTATEGNDAHC